MCGLVGVITKNKNGFNQKHKDIFEQLLWVDTLRGDDATGVFLVTNQGNVEIAKEASTGHEFVAKKEFKELLSSAWTSGWALIGHNRKATRGTINDENAHPFWVDDKIVLVHNGSMFGSHKHLKDVEVDSHAIAHKIAEGEDVEKTLQQIDAAYALIWYNVEKRHLNIIRNVQRPLSFVETHDAWYFASELTMLYFILSRNNEKPLDKEKGYQMFEPSILNTWALDDRKETTVTSTKLDCTFRSKYHTQRTPDYSRLPWDGCMAGYGGDSGCNNEEQGEPEEAPVELTPATAATKAVDVLYPWMKKTKYKQWLELKEKTYYTNARLKVTIDDYVPSDNASAAVWVCGTSVDNHNTHVSFPISKKLFESITDPKLDAALFYVDVDVVRWRAAAGNETSDFNEVEGYMTIVGKNPKMVFSGNHTVQ